MLRLALLLLTLAATPAAAATPAVAGDLRLRDGVLVDAAEITLGDLFDGVPARLMDAVVANAPQPGERTALRLATVLDAVERNGLSWQPARGQRSVAVARAGTAVPRPLVTQRVHEALAGQLGAGRFSIAFNGAGPALYVPVDETPSVQVQAIDFDPRSSRFTALLVAPADARTADPVRVSGRIVRTTMAPVLKNRVDPGDVINASDVELREIGEDQMRNGAIADVAELVGFSPKRALPVGQPVRAADVQRPMAVQKNALVTMTVRTAGMQLSALGRAVDAGAVGDVVQVMNVQSKKTVQAVVVGPNLVQVALPTVVN